VVFKCRQAGLPIASSDLFRHPRIEQLAALAGRTGQVTAVQEPVEGAVPLTPIQHEFFERHTVAPHHLTQSVLIELTADLDVPALRTALAAVVGHHDALRMRYVRKDGAWSQWNAAVETGELLVRHDLSGVPEADRRSVMNRLAGVADSAFDLEHGPLLRAVLFDTGPDRRSFLHLTVHHLVVDAVSWRILNHDLDAAYRQALAGGPVVLGDRTTSFLQWSRQLSEHVAGGGFAEQLDYWTAAPDGAPLPVDRDGPNVVSARTTLPVRLDERETAALLHVAPGVFRARVSDVLVSALAWTLCRWTGSAETVIEMEGHGREEIFDGIDLSRTVGWFTSSYPVLLRVPGPAEADWPAVVRSVRRCLRAVPDNGIGFGALRHLSEPGAAAASLRDRPAPQVLFNYHSQVQDITRTDDRSLYHAFHEGIGQEQHEDERVAQLFEVVGAVQDGRLGFDIHYSTDLHDTETVAAVFGRFQSALRALARHCDPALNVQAAVNLEAEA
jgi:non-ribosomal peptide synthase protein (TIGR01720 family)